MKIEGYLKTEFDKLKHIEKPELRATALLKDIMVEYSLNSSIDLLGSAQKGLVEMVKEMEKTEYLEDLTFAITIINHYIKNGDFKLIALPYNNDSKQLANRYKNIKTFVIEMISVNNY